MWNRIRRFFLYPSLHTNIVPWPLILWRVVWLPFFHMTRLVLTGVTLIAFGREDAAEVYEGTRVA